MQNIIPTTYAEWRHCITEVCGIPLTESYIQERIKALNNFDDHMTTSFVRLYGEPQRQATIGWFEQALQETTQA